MLTGGARRGIPDRSLLAADGADRRACRRPDRSRGDVRAGGADGGDRLASSEAIELTNASPYGLLAAIFTADLNAGLRFADASRTGWVNINESTNYWEAHLPFGGRSGTDSGIGRVGGANVMQSFTELQTIVITPDRRA